MSFNTFGHMFRVTTFGESHGPAIGCVVDGCPPRIPLTEADIRTFTTLVRFDVAYFSIFKCNKKRIADYRDLSNYMRELYQVPGIAATTRPR